MATGDFFVIIKVGSQTLSRFRKLKCYKAITIDEILSCYKEISVNNASNILIVVEQLYAFEKLKALEVFKDIEAQILINKDYYLDGFEDYPNVSFKTLQEIKDVVETESGIPQFYLPRSIVPKTAPLVADEVPVQEISSSTVSSHSIEEELECKILSQKIESLESELTISKNMVTTLEKEKEALLDNLNRAREGSKLEKVSNLDIVNKQRSEIDALTHRVTELERNIADLNIQLENYKSTIASLEKERDSLKDTINKVRENTQQESVKNLDLINKQRDEITGLSTTITDLSSKNSDLNLQILQKNQELSDITGRVTGLQLNIKELKQKLQTAQSAVDKYKNLAAKYQAAYTKTNEKVLKLQKELEEAHSVEVVDNSEQVSELQDKIAELTVKAEALTTELTEYKEANTDMTAKIGDLEKDNTSIKEDNKSLLAQLKQTEEKLKDAETLSNAKIADLKQSNEDALRRANNIIASLKDESSSYTTTVTQLGKNIRDMRIQLNAKQEELNSIIKEKTQIEAELQKSRQDVQLNIKYTGRAKIVSVYGSGSHGVSVMAASIAHKLEKSKVLIMDLDTRSPKLDKYMQKTPMINSLVDIKNPIERSSFAVFLNKGIEYLKQNKDAIQTVGFHTKGSLDYFSGLYMDIEPYRLMSADYTSLFNYLGEIYDYIVLDLGIMGNPISDKFIKGFSTIAYKEVLVTLNCPVDVRATVVHIANKGFRLNNTVWILNLSKTTTLDTTTKQLTSKAYETLLITMNVDMYGSNRTLDRMPITNGMFSKLVEMLN